ncbi:MAG: pilus assembly protein PilM [Polyangiaceae bacterium]|nr:pilus assembly protein PilM [Polyangiaceae bacterium]
MSRVIGIDIRSTHVRAALLRTSYRRITVERMLEVDVAQVGSLEEAVRACAAPLVLHGEGIAVALDGDRTFVHRIELPASARRQIDDVLPFEIEAQVPVELEELVYDYRQIGSTKSTEPITMLVAAARTEVVRERIALVTEALKVAPDRIGVGPLALANLHPVLPAGTGAGSVALVDLGGASTEVVVVVRGEVAFARTLSRGMASLPEGAPALAAELRQTLAAASVHGGDLVERVLLLGSGANDANSPAYLEYMLGVPVSAVAELGVDGIGEHERHLVPLFAKSIALGLSLVGKPRDLDLRQGPLAEQRGLLFLQEKAPLLTGLVGAIIVSFLFATWAERQLVDREGIVLNETLRALSQEVLGKEMEDPDAVLEALGGAGEENADPMPHADAFDVMLELSRGIPMDLTHDIDELELKRGHVKLNGVVASKSDAQKVATIMSKWRCAENVKVVKITQGVNSDRQKYVLEFDVRCPEDAGGKRKAKAKEEGKDDSRDGSSAPEATKEEQP